VHPKDAADRGLTHGEVERVRSRRGEIELRLKVSHREALGNCFIPFHFREAAANVLAIDEIDPYGKIPDSSSAPSRSSHWEHCGVTSRERRRRPRWTPHPLHCAQAWVTPSACLW
jgi:predicted molibdopterin-dependent oxidoreductase YjgC